MNKMKCNMKKKKKSLNVISDKVYSVIKKKTNKWALSYIGHMGKLQCPRNGQVTWSAIPLKDFHLFKIAELNFFFKLTDSTILNMWESFSGIVDKWRGPLEDCIIFRVDEWEIIRSTWWTSDVVHHFTKILIFV